MVIEACGRNLFEGEVVREGRTRPGQSSLSQRKCGYVLELLVLINDLYSTQILLLCGLFAHICEVAIDRHDRRCRGVPSIGGRSTK